MKLLTPMQKLIKPDTIKHVIEIKVPAGKMLTLSLLALPISF